MVGVLPILLRSTGQVNLFSPLYNMMVAPIVSLITMGLLALALIPVSFLGDIVAIGLSYILWRSQIGSQYILQLSMHVRSVWMLAFVLLAYRLYWIWKQTNS